MKNNTVTVDLAELHKTIEQLELKKSDIELCIGMRKKGNQFVPKQSSPLLNAINASLAILQRVESGELRAVVLCKKCCLKDSAACIVARYGSDKQYHSPLTVKFCSYGREKDGEQNE